MLDWQVLRQYRAPGAVIDLAIQAVAYLHNVRMGHIQRDVNPTEF